MFLHACFELCLKTNWYLVVNADEPIVLLEETQIILFCMIRYLSVRWGIKLSKILVFVGEKGDTDYEDLLVGLHKTLILEGSVENGSEKLVRSEDSYKREDMVPQDSPNIVTVHQSYGDAHNILQVVESFGDWHLSFVFLKSFLQM